jgi:hypothetical protein
VFFFTYYVFTAIVLIIANMARQETSKRFFLVLPELLESIVLPLLSYV